MSRTRCCMLLLSALLFGCTDNFGPADGGVTSTCTAPTGPGTNHSYPSADETWTAAGSPHILDHSITIPEGITVTVEGCAVVQLGDAVELVVDGKLAARGTASQPILFTRLDPAKPWARIDAARTKVMPPLELAWTTLEGGGVSTGIDLEQSQALRVRAHVDTIGEPMLFAEHLTVKGSSAVGIELDDSATFSGGSSALTVTGSASAPVRLGGFALTTLPDGDYSGNAVDRIVLLDHQTIGQANQVANLVMHRRNVPYRVGGYGETVILALGASSGNGLTQLRIEPGTTVTFKKGFGMEVNRANGLSTGELIAQGTADEPITFTSDSANPQAGDWRGLMFGAPPTSQTLLDHTVFAYAGSTTSETSGFSCGTEPAVNKGSIVGALTFATNREVTRQILTNSLITDSGSNGIDRGWTGAETDYLATNQFQRIAYCTQTSPKPSQGSCQSPAPCPRAQ